MMKLIASFLILWAMILSFVLNSSARSITYQSQKTGIGTAVHHSVAVEKPVE